MKKKRIGIYKEFNELEQELIKVLDKKKIIDINRRIIKMIVLFI